MCELRRQSSRNWARLFGFTSLRKLIQIGSGKIRIIFFLAIKTVGGATFGVARRTKSARPEPRSSFLLLRHLCPVCMLSNVRMRPLKPANLCARRSRRRRNNNSELQRTFDDCELTESHRTLFCANNPRELCLPHLEENLIKN